ncbi:MAG TPA: patatin-like phospholipase family protein [Pseudonocardiaceae bacterium]
MSTPRKKRSLILAGGGIKVAFQAGVMQVWLDEADLSFDHVDGASGGTFNLAMLCQGMTGTEIADNWRATSPVAGISPNWPQLLRGPYAESILTMDGYRRNVFPVWGLDWNAIRASDIDATFNIFNFTSQQLDVLPPGKMSEDFLVGCVTLPMWFPPVRIEGNTYIDAVYVTDGDLEEALTRGADEIWVIWTVSERGEWYPGLVATYFQIIEATANGHLRRTVERIERNNKAVAAGKPGEFGKHIELKMLQAEVPMHYIADINADRMHEMVNRGVAAARAWCAEQGIPLLREVPPSRSSSPVSLGFTEDMSGHVGIGESGFVAGREKGIRQHTPLAVHLTIKTDDVDRFVTDPDHEASLTGYVSCEAFGGKLPVLGGTFNLFVDRGDPTRKEMRYRIHVEDGERKPLTVVGVKTVQSANPLRIWPETSTLYTRVLHGHVAPADDEHADVAAAGVIRIHPLSFLRQLTTFRVSGASATDRVAGMTRFSVLFLGKLWDVYARPILNTT